MSGCSYFVTFLWVQLSDEELTKLLVELADIDKKNDGAQLGQIKLNLEKEQLTSWKDKDDKAAVKFVVFKHSCS